jgi:hypothetical protein
MEAAMQQAQAMRQARAAGLRPGEKQMDTGRPNPEGEGGNPNPELPVNDSGEIGELPDLKSMTKVDWAKLPPKVAKKILENNRQDMSPEFREAIISYLTEVAKRSRKKSAPGPQK